MFFFQTNPFSFFNDKVMTIILLIISGATALGFLLSSIVYNTNSKESLFPLLFYPLTLPLLICGLQGILSLTSKDLPNISSCVSKVTDTLQIAREKHPGQRNSLDALVKRYEIGGYDRELHGALLDSQILGDVYLSMTGGQSALDFSQTSNQELSENNQEKSNVQSSLNLKVVELNEEELTAHKEYLLRMKDETGIEPIGLN